MRIRLALVVLAVSGLFALGAHAAPAPTAHWIGAKVSAAGGAITLESSKGSFTVASDTKAQMQQFLTDQAGYRLILLVEDESATTLKVEAALGENTANHSVKIQPATDDYSAIAYVKKHRLFMISGEVTSEEEEGGLLYYDVPITSGGTGGDPNTGYVLASDVSVVRY